MAYEKRPDLGHDYRLAHRCRLLADRAEILRAGFDSLADRHDVIAYGRDRDAWALLLDEAGPLLARVRERGSARAT